jgi:hypothetical protein
MDTAAKWFNLTDDSAQNAEVDATAPSPAAPGAAADNGVSA